MKTLKRVTGTLALLSGLVLAAPLLSGSAKADITIAVAGPQTGPFASFFEQMRQGSAAAIEDVNAKGGVAGQKLKLETLDDACDPKQAVAVANQAVSRKIDAVVGHFCSASSIAASDVYAENNILLITPASSSPTLTERGLSTVFRTSGRDDQQAGVLAKGILARKLGTTLAVVHDKSSYGKGLADSIRAQLEQAGLKAVLYEAITPGERDFGAVIAKLKNAKVDLVVFGGYHTEAGLLVRQAEQAGLTAQFVGGDGLATKDLVGIAGGASQKVIFTFYPDPRFNPALAALVARFRERGFDPEGFTLYSYAAVQVLAEGYRRAGKVDGPKLAAALRSQPVDTILAKTNFNAKGDPDTENFILYTFNAKGEFQPL